MWRRSAALAVVVVSAAWAAPAVAQAPGTPPVGVADSFPLFPTLRATVPVLANDSDPGGQALRIVAHTDPAHGTVSCSATDCTYVPPVRSDVPPADSDGVMSPERPDSFTYTVANTQDLTATATVKLEPVVPRAVKSRQKQGRCRPVKRRTSRTRKTKGPSVGISQVHAAGAARCRVTRKKRTKTPDPGIRPGAMVPGVDNGSDSTTLAPAVFLPLGRIARLGGGPLARAASWASGLRYQCSFQGTGSQGIGQFTIHSWIGENGATGVNRLTLGYRVQVYGTDWYGRPRWVNVNVQSLAQNNSYPDSWNTWLPAGKDWRWVNHPWASANAAVSYGPWRLQMRAQYLKHHTFRSDSLVHQLGWGTLRGCQGQPTP